MNAPAEVVDRLRRAGITEAAIIDDVFDGPANVDIRTRSLAFLEDVEDDDDASAELRENYGIAPGDQLTIEVARKLWADREHLRPALRRHIDLLFADYRQRKKDLRQIEAHLKELGINVKCYGDAGRDPTRLPPESTRFILLDYSLTPDEGPRYEASEWCSKQLCARQNRPFLVLISDQPAAEVHKDRFRKTTEQLGGTFAFVRKQQAVRSDIFYLQIATWVLGHPAHKHLQAFVQAVINSMDETVEHFRNALRELTMQDYSFIQRITLEEEGQPLGEYMLEFLTGLLSHTFRANPQIQQTRQELDRLAFDHHVASDTQPSAELAKMYRAALTDPVFEDVGLHPHDSSQVVPTHEEIAACAYEIWEAEGRPPDRADECWFRAKDRLSSSLPLLSLGDIFIKDAQSSLWMVVNAACDLLFSPRSRSRQPRREQPIYLIRGAFVDLHDTADVGNNEVTELFAFEEKAYRILWDYHYVRSISLQDFTTQVTAKGYHRKARLALPYALKVQRAWTAHLDRIGLPSPPPMFDEADVSIYAQKSENEWVRIGDPVQGGAILVSRKVSGGYEELCVLTMNGENAVYEGLGSAINLVRDRLAELEGQVGSLPEAEKRHLRAKIQRTKAIHQKMIETQQDASWRLRLLENPKAISSKGPAWAVERMLAMYFEAGAQRAFDKQAQLVVDITRPATHSVVAAGDVANETPV